VGHLNQRLIVVSTDNLEGPQFHVFLHFLVSETSSNQTLSIKDGVFGVTSDLSLGGISDETLLLSESNVRGGGVETLIVSNNLNLIVLPDSNARVSCSEIG